MKILLIYPPIWDINLAPMLSTPMLTNMLNQQGHEAEFIDINSMYMNFILNKDFMDYYQKKIESYQKQIKASVNGLPSPETLMLAGYSIGFINTFHKNRSFLLDFYEKNPNANFDIDALFNREGREIYNRYQIYKNITMDIFINNYNGNVPDEYRLLYDWEEKILNEIIEKQPEMIGFSIYCIKQYKWALQFARRIKKRIKTKIFFGGNHITSIRSLIDKEVFNNCVDVFMYSNGEIPMQMLTDGEDYENIPSIIYLDKDNNIKINPNLKKGLKFFGANYDTVDFKDYFVPDPVIPIESSRGCYWGKCEFCDFMDCMSYRPKKVDDLLDELQEYVEKYNAHHFFFTDAAMHPEYAREFSKKVLEKNLKIYFLTDFRFEKEFDEELLKLMYDAGLRVALWGLESGSDRILQMYNKGTTVDGNSKIIKLASEMGIFNWCWTMILFPKETAEDMIMTKNFLFEHYNYIDYISLHNFTLLPNSPITKKYKEFGLTSSNYFKPDHDLHLFSKKIRQEIFDLYKPKMDMYPDDLTNMLLKRSREKP